MIMARNEDGTYSQVGFVKDNAGIDTEYIYDKDGDIVFEKGFTRETSGTVPLTINGIGKGLKDWSITGNTVQNGTPTPENPVEVLGCGDYDSETGMYKIPVVTRGKNLLDYKTMYGIKYKYLSKNGEVLDSRSWAITDYIPCSGNVFTINPIGGKIPAICLYDSQKNYITGLSYDTGGAKYKKAITIRSKINASYIRFSYYIDSDEGADDLSKIQIEIGDTATPYEPYHEPITTPIYLDKPLYKIGDYADTLCYAEQKAERYIKELILTGEENITSHSVINDIVGVRIPTPATVAAASPAICTHAINVTWANFYASRTYAKVATNVSGGNSIVYMSAPDSEHNTLSGIKDYLAAQYAAGTPVKVYYVLATPETKTVEPVKIPTLNGTTVIDVDTAVKPTDMHVKYKSSK